MNLRSVSLKNTRRGWICQILGDVVDENRDIDDSIQHSLLPPKHPNSEAQMLPTHWPTVILIPTCGSQCVLHSSFGACPAHAALSALVPTPGMMRWQILRLVGQPHHGHPYRTFNKGNFSPASSLPQISFLDYSVANSMFFNGRICQVSFVKIYGWICQNLNDIMDGDMCMDNSIQIFCM